MRSKNIYLKKRILITGHTGFKGSWLSIWLGHLGADVLGFSLDPPSTPNNFEACRLNNKMTDIRGDVRDFSRLANIFKEFQPEFVFHLAAQPLVLDSYQNPRETFEVNSMGTVNICEAIRLTPSVRSFINVTTDKCYENREWIWGYRENDILGGYDAYSSSKACSELITQAYIRSFFENKGNIGVATVRAGNVIGGGDWGRYRLLTDCIRALSNEEKILVRSPEAIRPWQYVLEPLLGYITLASKLYENPKYYSGAWNFGPCDENCVRVQDIVEMIISIWGSGSWAEISSDRNNEEHEMKILRLNSEKAYFYLKWKSILDVRTAIKSTVEWYKIFYQPAAKDMYGHCLKQIVKYMSLTRTKI